jgi:hypothetical protein
VIRKLASREPGYLGESGVMSLVGTLRIRHALRDFVNSEFGTIGLRWIVHGLSRPVDLMIGMTPRLSYQPLLAPIVES